jgi:hypothetical protein
MYTCKVWKGVNVSFSASCLVDVDIFRIGSAHHRDALALSYSMPLFRRGCESTSGNVLLPCCTMNGEVSVARIRSHSTYLGRYYYV